jgi:nucleoside 2-deoxyribosyltransferase
MGPVYYAGPLFTDAERSWNAANASALRSFSPSLEVLLPQEFCAPFDTPPGGKPNFAGIFQACLEHLQRSQVVLAILDGADADSGTCWELGYAYLAPSRGRSVQLHAHAQLSLQRPPSR